ncbi:MAG: hypothetical protein K2J55_04630, partial [Eubacterium sp.]|nr:hypothetical protein [Eubacterium sp.]
ITQDFDNNYIYVSGSANVARQINVTGSFTTDYTDAVLNLIRYDSAILNVQRAVPAIVTDVYNYNPATAEYGDPYTVPVNVNNLGFRYRISNNCISRITPAKLESGVLVKASGSDYLGFIVEHVILSKELVETTSSVKDVQLYFAGSSTPVVVPFNTTTFTKDASGNYVLDVSKYSGGATLLKYEVDFNSFEANVKQSDDIYVLSEGHANVIGNTVYGYNSYNQWVLQRDTRIYDTAIFRTDYTDTTQNHSASDRGIMAVAITSPIVKAYAYDGRNPSDIKRLDCSEASGSTESLSVPIDTDLVGFDYWFSNNSISEIAPGVFTSGAFGFKSGTDTYGLLAKRLIFSAKMFDDPKCVISSIQLTTSGSTTPITFLIYTSDAAD